MNKKPFLRGGEVPYLKPELEVTTFASESGFQASLPSIGTEEGGSWEEID